jgi:hypothetical protein
MLAQNSRTSAKGYKNKEKEFALHHILSATSMTNTK